LVGLFPGGSCSESGSCAPRTPKQEELHKKLTQLRQEKEELDIKLHGESCQADPVETQLEAEKTRLAQVNNKIDYLKGTKANIEAKIAALKERSAERTKAIDTLSQYVDTEKTKLQGEMDKATKELQVEAQGRISIQEQLVSAYEQQQGGACPFNPQADAPAAMAAQSPNVSFYVNKNVLLHIRN